MSGFAIRRQGASHELRCLPIAPHIRLCLVVEPIACIWSACDWHDASLANPDTAHPLRFWAGVGYE